MITRHTTTITAPIAIPTSLIQLQEHMAGPAVPVLSIKGRQEATMSCKQQHSVDI
jgi:hypothetical protein